MHELAVRVGKAAAVDARAVKLAELRAKLAEIGASDQSGSEEHRALLKEFQALRHRKQGAATTADDNDAAASAGDMSAYVAVDAVCRRACSLIPERFDVTDCAQRRIRCSTPSPRTKQTRRRLSLARIA